MRAAVWVVIETAGLHSLFISVHSSAPTTRPRWINLNKGNRGSVKRCDRRQHREQLRIRVKLCAASKLWRKIKKAALVQVVLWHPVLVLGKWEDERRRNISVKDTSFFCRFVPNSCFYSSFLGRTFLFWFSTRLDLHLAAQGPADSPVRQLLVIVGLSSTIGWGWQKRANL